MTNNEAINTIIVYIIAKIIVSVIIDFNFSVLVVVAIVL